MRKNVHFKRLEEDFSRWLAKGLINPDQASTLRAEAAAHYGGAGGSSPILSALAMVAFIIGLMTVIAANWAGFSGVIRLVILYSFLALSVFGASFMQQRGKALLGNFAATLAAALFGGGLVIIGQLYHSGATASEFFSAWAIGAVVVAILLGAPLAAALAALLGVIWTFYHFGDAGSLFSDQKAFNAPLWVLPLWAALGAMATAHRSLGVVHVLAFGAISWLTIFIIDWYAVRHDVYLALFLALFWGAVAAITEVAARTTPLWAIRTIAGWSTWAASLALVAAASMERVKPVFFTALDLAVVALGVFSALTAYGAAPGRRWLRGAGVAGFIATALIFFTLADNLMGAGLTLIGFSVALAVLIVITNKMLASASRAQEGEI